MAYSPLGEATVTAEAFPMLSTGPSPTWLLKLSTCQPITLASCWTACTWCWDICNDTRWTQGYTWLTVNNEELHNRCIYTASSKYTIFQPWYLWEEEVLQLLFLVWQCDDTTVSVHHSDLFNTDVQLQLDGPNCTKHNEINVTVVKCNENRYWMIKISKTCSCLHAFKRKQIT